MTTGSNTAISSRKCLMAIRGSASRFCLHNFFKYTLSWRGFLRSRAYFLVAAFASGHFRNFRQHFLFSFHPPVNPIRSQHIFCSPLMKDFVILVDTNDREVGTAEKLEAHRLGLLHRAISVFVFNRKGELLLQRRQWDKYHSGGQWSNACCSHPRPGEESATAA